MNIWITAAPTTSPSAAHAIRQRLMAPRMPERPPVPALVAPAAVPAPDLCKRHKDDHILRWERWKLKRAMPCKAYIELRCDQMSVPYADVMSQTRNATVVTIRDMIVFELKSEIKPSLTWPELGRMFGKDHSSMYLSYYRGAAASGDAEAAARVALKHRRSRDSKRRTRARERA